MEISSANQAYVFLTMILCGALCTAVFDVFRAIRRFKKSSCGIIAFQDIAFWLIELAIVYLVAFRLNYAKVRAYEIIALFIGSFIYFVTLSEYVIRILCCVIGFAVRTVRKIIYPVVKISSIMSKPLIKLRNQLFLKLRVLAVGWGLKYKSIYEKLPYFLTRTLSFLKKNRKENKNS